MNNDNRASNAGASEGEKRRAERTKASTVIDVNGGVPYRGGLVHDLSSTGVAVVYPDGIAPIDGPLNVGEPLNLVLGGVAKFPARVARIFDGGYAVRFDTTIDMRPAFT